MMAVKITCCYHPHILLDIRDWPSECTATTSLPDNGLGALRILAFYGLRENPREHSKPKLSKVVNFLEHIPLLSMQNFVVFENS